MSEGAVCSVAIVSKKDKLIRELVRRGQPGSPLLIIQGYLIQTGRRQVVHGCRWGYPRPVLRRQAAIVRE